MNHRGVSFREAKDVYQSGRSSGKLINSTRLFGVEFEMVPPPTINNDAKRGMHLVSEKIVPQFWGVGADGSLSDRTYGIEVQTPPMRLKEGEDALRKFCEDVQPLGWITDNSCGIHVHLDCNDIKEKPELIRRLFLTYFVIDHSMLAMLPESRRANAFCAPLDKRKAKNLVRLREYRGYDKGFDVAKIVSINGTKKSFLEMFYKTAFENVPYEISKHYNEARYHGINFHPLYGNYGTVEIRYLEGTLDPDVILNWIAFHQHIVDHCRLVRDVDAIELFNIKGPRNRLRRLAEIIKMPTNLVEFGLNRIKEFKTD